jgi:uncharacterized protein YqcC (DUF446 family)
MPLDPPAADRERELMGVAVAEAMNWPQAQLFAESVPSTLDGTLSVKWLQWYFSLQNM